MQVPQRLTDGGAADSAILWRLQGRQSPVVCELHRLSTGVRLNIRCAGALIAAEWWPDVETAEWRAQHMRGELLALGWSPD